VIWTQKNNGILPSLYTFEQKCFSMTGSIKHIFYAIFLR
jgi:hypothetical protein